MILPVKFLWEQLDGPQVQGIENATFQYFKEMFDDKLDYLNTMDVSTANDNHLTFLGILANFVRPVITVPDKDFFFLTENVESQSSNGFSSIDNRTVGGRLVGIEGATTEARPLNTEHYRLLLKAYVESDGELGGLILLDDICYLLSKLDQPTVTPFYTFEFMEGDSIPAGRAPGDVYIDIGSLADWNNPMQIYAILRGLAKSTYWPVPQLFISIDTAITVPTPTSSLPSGTYTGTQTVTLSDTMSTATIYYTTNGSTPTTETNLYNPLKPIEITSSTLLRVRAYAARYNTSAIAEFNYIIE